jgi:cell division protein FtsL
MENSRLQLHGKMNISRPRGRWRKFIIIIIIIIIIITIIIIIHLKYTVLSSCNTNPSVTEEFSYW